MLDNCKTKELIVITKKLFKKVLTESRKCNKIKTIIKKNKNEKSNAALMRGNVFGAVKIT